MNALDVIRIKMHQILTCLNNTTYIPLCFVFENCICEAIFIIHAVVTEISLERYFPTLKE